MEVGLFKVALVTGTTIQCCSGEMTAGKGCLTDYSDPGDRNPSLNGYVAEEFGDQIVLIDGVGTAV